MLIAVSDIMTTSVTVKTKVRDKRLYKVLNGGLNEETLENQYWSLVVPDKLFTYKKSVANDDNSNIYPW